MSAFQKVRVRLCWTMLAHMNMVELHAVKQRSIDKNIGGAGDEAAAQAASA